MFKELTRPPPLSPIQPLRMCDIQMHRPKNSKTTRLRNTRASVELWKVKTSLFEASFAHAKSLGG